MILKCSGVDWLRLLITAGVVALAIPASAIPAGEKRPGTKVVGVVTAVDSTRVSILGGDGSEVTVQTAEDFSERVTVGSEVTAWYSSKGGANVLEWIDTPREVFFVPAGQIRQGIRKIILLPKSDVPGADDLFDAITDYLQSHTGWYVGSRLLAEEIRNRTLRAGVAGSRPTRSTLEAIDPATGEFDLSRYAQSQAQTRDRGQAQPQPSPSTAPRASTIDAIDPSTGQFDMDRYLRAQAEAQSRRQAQPPVQTAVAPRAPREESLIPRLAADTRVDAVLEVDVVEVQAAVSRLVARWDGAEEPIAGKGSESIARVALGPGRGAVPATTVVLRLWDSHGILLWTSRAGFAVLAVKEGLRDKLRERPLREVVGNRAAVDKWLSTTLAPLLPDSGSPGRMGRKQ